MTDTRRAAGARYTRLSLADPRSYARGLFKRSDIPAYALLVAITFMAAAWASLARDIPDEHGYFAEIAAVAATGTSQTFTGHVVGVWAYAGALAHVAGEALGISPLIAVRLLGVILIAIVSWLAYRTAGLIGAGPFTALGTMALVGFNPMYSFMGASANSDTMVVLWVSVVVWLSVLMVRRGVSAARVALVIAAIVLGYYTKDRALLAVPVAGLALLLSLGGRSEVVLRAARRVRGYLRPERVFNLVIALLVVLILSRNEWLGPQMARLVSWDPVASPVGPLPSPATVCDIWTSAGFGDRLARQFYAYFGYLHVPAPPFVYTVQNTLMILALAGAAVALARLLLRTLRPSDADPVRHDVRSGPDPAVITRGLGLVVLGAAVAVAMYAVAFYQLRLPGGTQGRYLFPVIIPIYALMTASIRELLPLDAEVRATVALVLVAGLVNAYCLLYVLLPYFY